MTIEVKFTGYVNEVKEFDWGRVLSVSHQQRQRSVGGDGWETVGYDYLEVIPSRHEEVYQKGDLIDVHGKLKTKKFETKTGEARVSLQVRALEIRKKQGEKRGAAAIQQVWGDVKPEAVEPWPEVSKPGDSGQVPF